MFNGKDIMREVFVPVVVKTSPIHGHGVFAVKPIEAGECLFELLSDFA